MNRPSIMDKGVVEARARVLLEAWLRGQTRGGHTPSPQDIGEVYGTCLHNALHEMINACPRRPSKGDHYIITHDPAGDPQKDRGPSPTLEEK